jgi:AraC-like DNA-binding protein
MKRNFTTWYATPHKKPKNVTGNLPGYCRYPIRYAKASLYEWDDGNRLVNQYYRRFQFYMELFEYKVKHELKGGFTIKSPCLFLFMMLDGTVHFYTPDGQRIYDAKKGMCYATANDTGDFYVTLPAGNHLFFYLQPQSDYLKCYPKDYPDLAELLESLAKDQKQYGHMPACLIEGEILTAMLNLYRLAEGKGYDLETEFYRYCRELLRAYHKTVRLRLEKPIYQIRDFLTINYTDHKLTAIKALAGRFHLSVRMLEREYHREFDTSPQYYIKKLRMEKSKQLILDRHTIHEVSIMLGYSETSCFSRAFKSYYGHAPTQAKDHR